MLVKYLANTLTTIFRHQVRDDADKAVDFGNDRPLINYMWINRAKAATNPDGPMCAIGLQYIERAVENGNRYPQADFKLWIDKKLLDDSTHFWLGSFLYERMKHGNIEICDLQTIPDYANDPLFVPIGPSGSTDDDKKLTLNVYIRADYARILILDHCLKTYGDRSRFIYSDIDSEDIHLFRASNIMDRRGIVINDMGSHSVVSHGYIGLAAKNRKIQAHFKELKECTRMAAYGDALGFRAFDAFLVRIGLPLERSREKIGIHRVLPRCGYRIAPDKDIQQLGIN